MISSNKASNRAISYTHDPNNFHRNSGMSDDSRLPLAPILWRDQEYDQQNDEKISGYSLSRIDWLGVHRKIHF